MNFQLLKTVTIIACLIHCGIVGMNSSSWTFTQIPTQLAALTLHQSARDFTTTNWLTLNGLNAHHFEGNVPTFYSLEQYQVSPLLASAAFTVPANTSPQIIPITPTTTNYVISSQPQASSFFLNQLSFQSRIESSHAYNSVSSQQSQLFNIQKQESYLAHQPRGLQIYHARQNVLLSDYNNAIKTLREAIQTPLNPTYNSANGIAQIARSWHNAHQIKFSNQTINENYQNLVQEINLATTDPVSHNYAPLNILNDNNHLSLQKKIDAFEKQLQNFSNNPISFKQNALQDTHDYLSYHGRDPFHVNPNDSGSWKFLAQKNEYVSNKIHASISEKNIAKMITLCDGNNFAEARAFALEQQKSGADILPLQALHESKFYEKFTVEGIDKRFITDPLYLAKKDGLRCFKEQNLLSVPHPLNAELAARHSHYQHLTKELGLTNPDVQAKQLIYNVIDKQIQNSSGVNPCQTFIDLAKFPICNTEQAASVQTGMNYLNEGLKNDPESSSFLKLAHAQALALKNPKSAQELLHLADYSTPTTSVHQAEIQKSVVKLISDNVSISNDNVHLLDGATVSRVNRAYVDMLKGDIRAEYYLQNGLTPELNKDVLSVDYDAQLAHFSGLNASHIVAHVQERKDITKVLLTNGAEFKLQSYELLPSIEKFLVHNGLDPAKFKSLYGHQLQHATHKNILEQVAKQHELSGLRLIENSNLSRMLSLSTQISDLSRQHNVLGDVAQAGILSNFSWQLMDHIKHTAKGVYNIGAAPFRGVASGTLELISNYAHAVQHPITSVTNCINNLGNLGESGLKMVHHIDDQLGLILNGSPQQSARAIGEVREQILRLKSGALDFVKREGISGTIERAAHHGTTFVGDIFVMNKTLAALEKFSVLAKGQIVEYAQQLAVKASQTAIAAETIATTAEGLQVRAAAAAEQCVLSEAQQVGNGARNASLAGSTIEAVEKQVINSIENSIPTTIENLNSCSAIYEKLSQFPNQIWKKIKPTQEFWNPHSLIPKSFEIEVEGQKFWVHPNATEHLMELTSPLQSLRNDLLANASHLPAKQTLLGHEMLLTDFYDAVKAAIKSDDIYQTKNLSFNGWEIGINPSRAPGGSPVIVHAFKKVL